MSSVWNDLGPLAETYRLLGRLWFSELDESLLNALLTPAVSNVFTAVGGVLPTRCDEAVIEDLAVEFCQLFRGPANHLPPFQSVWQQERFQGAPAESMQTYIRVVGSSMPESMPDHLGVQLDVMSRLIDTELRMRDEAEPDSTVIARYFRTHLDWAERLFEIGITRARTDFYRSMILMTRDFLAAERSFWLPSNG